MADDRTEFSPAEITDGQGVLGVDDAPLKAAREALEDRLMFEFDLGQYAAPIAIEALIEAKVSHMLGEIELRRRT